MKYSEERRNDPVLRAKVAKIHAERKAMLLKAASQLKQLSDEMRELDFGEDHSIYGRCSGAVWTAYYKVSGDAEFMKKIGGETYIDNMAAGELGEIIERKGL